MRRSLILISIYVALSAILGCSSAGTAPEKQVHFWETVHAQNFYRGDLRVRSDANIKPYRSHGYQFLVSNSPVSEKKKAEDFAIVSGVDSVNVSALCPKSTPLFAATGASIVDSLSTQIAAAKASGAIVAINHPNFQWAIGPGDLLAIDNFEMLEIASGDPVSHDAGDESHPSVEELWDRFMTQKHKIYAIATNGNAAPGSASLMVWATDLSEPALCDALRNGHFYASRGSKLSALVVTARTFEIGIDGWQSTTDHVDFIGSGGQLLDRTFSNPARYSLRGNEGYVRAHVIQEHEKEKREAWTQAYYLKND